MDRPLSGASTGELVGLLVNQSTELVKKEVELAKQEGRSQAKTEIQTATGLGIAGLCSILALNMMLVAIAFALANVMPGWLASLVVAAAVLLVGTVAGLVGWGRRVQVPLERTQQTLREDVRWAKDRFA